jgi:hypothetical protein
LKSDSDGKAVAAKMKEMPTDDRLFGRGTVRVDGRKIHDAYLVEVKEPEESKYAADFSHSHHHPRCGSHPPTQRRWLPARERLGLIHAMGERGWAQCLPPGRHCYPDREIFEMQ